MRPIIRRRGMASKGGLPYDAEVEYLGFTGTQYIDTDYLTSDKSVISVRAKLNTVTKQARILGNSTGWFEIYINGSNYWSFTSNGSSYTTSSRANTNVWDFSINNVEKLAHYGNSSRTIAKNTSAYFGECYLMARPDAPTTFVDGLLYSATVEDEGLVRDYIPVRKNGVGFLYDKVTGRLFGTPIGTLLIGPDKLISGGVIPCKSITYALRAERRAA